MAFSPRVLSYEDVRREADECLGEYHRSLSVPTPIEEIVEFDLGIDMIPKKQLFEHPQRQRLVERLASELRVSELTMEIRLEKDTLIPALGADL